MKQLPAFFIFLLAFQIEIRVKALGHATLFQVPGGCLVQAGPCSIQTQKQPMNLNLGSSKATSKDFEGQLFLAPETLIVRDNLGQYRFQEGALRVEGDFDQNHSFRMDFLHGQIFSGSGSFSIRTQGRVQSGRVWISSESAALSLRLRSGQRLEIPAGFEVWVDGLNLLGQQDFGMIQPWDLKAHLKFVNRFSIGIKSKRLELASKLKPIAEIAGRQAGELNLKVAQRLIASLDEEALHRQKRDEQRRQEKIRLKKLYFERTFSR